jgi:hypothetical protein
MASGVKPLGNVGPGQNLTYQLDLSNPVNPYVSPVGFSSHLADDARSNSSSATTKKAPIAGTGAHRYTWLLFAEPANFVLPANFTNDDGSPLTKNWFWNLTDYVESSGLRGPYAATIVSVEVGEPSAGVTVVSPSPINTASLSSLAVSQASAYSASATSSSGAASVSQQFSVGFILGAVVLSASALLAW